MNHTKEPWEVIAVDDMYEIHSKTAGHEVVWSIDSIANAQRIVACVNACADITEEDLPIVIKYGREQLSRMQKLKSKKRYDETLDRNLDVIFGNKSTGTSTPIYYCPFCHRKLEDV